MAVTHNRYTVGTAATLVAADSADSQEVWLQNLAPANSQDAFSREGYSYIVSRTFVLANGGTALFNVETGSNGLQIQSYEIASSGEAVLAELVEGATVVTNGTVVASYNLNRNYADDAEAVFAGATSITGGSAISSEFVTGSKVGGGSMMLSGKVHSLLPNQDYGMRFINQGATSTTVFLQIVFAEKFNGQNDVWVGDAVGTGVRVRGGETVHMSLLQGQKLFAVASADNDLMVTRQD